MFTEITGDVGGAVSPAVAAILGFSSIAAAALTVWANRRPSRRRTDPAPSPPDVLPMHSRLSVVEEHVSDLHDAVIKLQAQQSETFYRLKRIEDRTWPT